MTNVKTIAGYDFDYLEQKLYTAVIGDILDDLGYRNQTLGAGVRMVDPKLKISGRVFTAQATKVFSVPAEPYKLQMEAIDSVSPGEVFVVSTGAPDEAAFWGELLATACRARGGRGAIVDGLNRDTSKILEMQFPLASRGQVPTDSKGRVDLIFYQKPIEIDGVRINPGDYVFADIDGIVFVPQAVEEEVIQKSLEKVEGENVVRKALQDGMLCTEAFKTFGIL
ncbi:RraA family protein [Paenibacillus aceris]|uniref:Putative 4-hydroxy-4-methyl-2-oxoglutarate aldolase n=1 Tax=Paenibacillus aceris TaxID=869555 RepID=A0ABS4I209_9BACL|nr:RraA family protein [Paenibacillus aceris]MBP1964949.1 regulator of RNase E activity RraA [Paenibacillus aceris]NHW35610.1 RraA family protein [Paenibacillus aceris]